MFEREREKMQTIPLTNLFQGINIAHRRKHLSHSARLMQKSLFFTLCHVSNMQIFNEFNSIVRCEILDILYLARRCRRKHTSSTINNEVYCALKAQFPSQQFKRRKNKKFLSQRGRKLARILFWTNCLLKALESYLDIEKCL